MPERKKPVTRKEWRLAIIPPLVRFTTVLGNDGSKSWMSLRVYDAIETEKTVVSLKVCITGVSRDRQRDKMAIIKGHTKDQGKFILTVFYHKETSEDTLLATGVK